jgi:hypothetical protein
MRTKAVSVRTTLLLCRFRFLLKTRSGKDKTESSCLTEESSSLIFTGSPENPKWQDSSIAESLLLAEPSSNIEKELASGFVEKVTTNMSLLKPYINKAMNERATALLRAHERVREGAKIKGLSYGVTIQGEPDIIGVFVYLPDFE